MIRFKGLIAPTEVPTGDSRMFAAGKASHRPLPIPMMAQFGSGGHAGATPVATIDQIYPGPGGYWGAGEFLDPTYAPDVPRAIYMLQKKVMGPSVDLDRDYTVKAIPHPARPDKKVAMFEEYNIIGCTCVPMPAFSQVYLSIENDTEGTEKSLLASAGVDLSLLLDKDRFDRVEDHPDWINQPSSFFSAENEADCGCGSDESELEVQGIVPNGSGVTMATAPATSTASGGTVATFIVNGIQQPTSVTFTFGDMVPYPQPFISPIIQSDNTANYPMTPVAPAEEEETPAAVVKVFEDKTVVKLPDEGIKVAILNEGAGDGPGCYFNDEGICPVCGY